MGSGLTITLIVSVFAQNAKPKAKPVDPEIKELQDARDTIKGTLKQKTSENSKDFNKVTKLEGEKNKLKDQFATAKKAKKQDKMDAIQEKITENAKAIKDLDQKLKEEDKEITQLEKELKKAEKDLAAMKENKMKAKAKK